MKKISIILIAGILTILVISAGYSIVNSDNNTDINSTVKENTTLNTISSNDSNDNTSYSDFNSEKNTQVKHLSQSNNVNVFEGVHSDIVNFKEDINSNVLDIYDENITKSTNNDSNHVEESSQTSLPKEQIPFRIVPLESLNSYR